MSVTASITLTSGATVTLLSKSSVHLDIYTSTVVFEVYSTQYLSLEDIREWVGGVIFFRNNVHITNAKLYPSDSGSGYDIKIEAVIKDPCKLAPIVETGLILTGAKFKLARQWEGFDEASYIVFIEDCGEYVICLFADGKRRLVPTDAINWKAGWEMGNAKGTTGV